MFKIMIVEDEKEVREELTILLQNTGYEVSCITHFKEVEKQILEQETDLILLDINLPEQNGYEICKKIRAKAQTPIIFLTSRSNTIDELNGIMLGADDYIEKPYHVPVLLARMQRLLNRTYQIKEENTKIEYKQLTLNTLDSTISYQGNKIELTRNEFKILYYLFQNKEQIIPRGDIIEYMWDHQMYIDDNTLSVNITRIREKLKEIGITDFIQTRRGQGYKI